MQELDYVNEGMRFSNLKDIPNVIRDKWHDVDVRQSKSEKPVEKASSSSTKENGESIQHIFCWSVDRWFSLLWRFGVACVPSATQMMNRLQNCFTAYDAILFVSRLIQKCFRRKFLHVFEDFCSLNICFCTDSFRQLGWIMHANIRDVFFATWYYCCFVIVIIDSIVLSCCLLYNCGLITVAPKKRLIWFDRSMHAAAAAAGAGRGASGDEDEVV